MTAPPAPHPAQHLLRLTNVLVAGVCAWGLWSVVQWTLEDFPRLSWWHLTYLVPLIAFAGCGAFFCWGVKSPTQSHLSLIVAAGFFFALGLIVTFGSQFIHWLVIPTAAESLNKILFWPTMVVTLILAITIDWRLGKAAGFIPEQDMWWGETNIRGFCAFLSWVCFFGGIGFLPTNPKEQGIFQLPDTAPIFLVIFLAFIAFCFFVGKALPHLLMSLTGITPKPREQKPRRRGFRLF